MKKFKQALKVVFDFSMYISGLVLLAQPIQILYSGSAKDVSVPMWLVSFLMQVTISLHGKLNLNSNSMFLGIGFSAAISLTTTILCLIYK